MKKGQARKLLAAEVFNSEAAEHFKWVIEKYIGVGDADRAVTALDDFFETFFPPVEEGAEKKGRHLPEVEEAAEIPKPEQGTPLFQQGRSYYTASDLAFGLVEKMEYLDETEQNSAVRSLARQLSSWFPQDEYGQFIISGQGARKYAKELEGKLIDCVSSWEERWFATEVQA